MSIGPPTERRDGAVGLLARRPALGATVFLITGILAHRALPHQPAIWLGTLAVLLVAAATWKRRPQLCSTLLAAAMFAAGLSAGQLAAFQYPRDHIGRFATAQRRLARIELDIDTEPRTLSDPFSARPMPPKQVVTATVKRILTWDGWRNAGGGILVQIAQPHPRLQLGQRVRVTGMLERPAPASNPGQFDWAHYYRQQRILTSIHVAEAGNITILSQRRLTPFELIRRESRRLLAQGFPAERSLDHALLRALLLGDSDPEMRDVQEQFKKTGTSHHLAISGMHVALLGGCVFWVCRLLRVRPRAALLLTMSFVAVYGIAALPSPPVVRSLLLCGFVGAGLAFRRSVDLIQLLTISVLTMLVLHPLDLYSPGFQLSFGTVLGLMLFAAPLSRWLASLSQDPLVVPGPTTGNKPILARAGAWAESSLANVFAAAMVAWLISTPLVMYHFEQANVWAAPASILLAPFVFFALVGALAKVLLTLLLPSLAGAWASMAGTLMALVRQVLVWLAQLPLSSFPVPGIPLWAVMLLLVLYLVFWQLPAKRPRMTYVIRAVPVLSLLATVALPLRALERAVAPEELRLTMLAVGAGQAAVLETPGGRTIVVDAGSNSLSDPLRKCIAPFLRTRGCTRVDSLLLTHSDYDHINAAADLAQVYDVREVLIGGRFRAHALDNPPAEGLLRSLDLLDLPPRVLKPGERFPLGRDVEIEILWPPQAGAEPRGLSSNDSAVVARLLYAGRSILITGDVQEQAQQELLRRYSNGELRADVLIAPHHGSSESTTGELIRAVDPRHIISSNDRTLTGKQRRLDRLVGKIPLYRTNECGAITVRVREDGEIQVERFLSDR